MKYIICLVFFIGLINSNISCNITQARDNPKLWDAYSWEDQEINGMKYRIYFDNDGYYGGALYIINITKDELEVQLLRKQLNQ